MIGKKFFKKALAYIVFAFMFCGTTYSSKSVFIISKHFAPSQAQSYRIDGDQVTYQAQVDIGTYNQGFGAVGNAIWPEKELMFVTYESSSMVVWSSTKTLNKIGEYNTDISNCAGIAIDSDKEKIYIVHRDNDDLYVYSFDENKNTLALDNHYDLSVPSGSLSAWGLALDEQNDLLYVSTGTERVHVYSTDDWSHDHFFDINVSGNDRDAVGIAVDPNLGYVYTGHWINHNYLVRTETSSPYLSIEVEITKEGYPSKELIGLDVDDVTGQVYCTTYHHDFRVYNSDLSLLDTEQNSGINGPAGVAIGGFYKPPEIFLDKVDVNAPNSLVPGDYITYEITYGPNDIDHNNVIITDYLPVETDFVTATHGELGFPPDPPDYPLANYDPDKHIVTYDIRGLNSSC